MFYASRKIPATLVTQRVGAYWSLGVRERAQARFQLAALIIACCQPLTTVGDACNGGIRVHGTPNVRGCRPLKRHADAYSPPEYAGKALINSGNQISCRSEMTTPRVIILSSRAQLFLSVRVPSRLAENFISPSFLSNCALTLAII